MNYQQMDATQFDILVVDDTTTTVNLLVGLLTSRGYKVRAAFDGQMALSAIQVDPPDLILLDIMLPQMNGYEVCKRLKADESTRDIPVIFISALDEALDKVKAFSCGGVDYIPKPFQIDEVIVRINTHLTIRNLQKNLEEQVAELDAFARTVAHDLKNPLGVITGFAGVLVDNYSRMPQHKKFEGLQNIYQSGKKATNIVNELLLLASVHKEDVVVNPVDMDRVMTQVQQRLTLMIEKYQGKIIAPDIWPVAQGYAPWIEEVWTNYLSNGLKYGGQAPMLTIGAVSEADGMIRFWIRDNGPGLDLEAQAVLFAEFTRLNEVRAEGHGLGLSIVRRIVEKLGGRVGVESTPGQGSEFYFTLPAVDGDE